MKDLLWPAFKWKHLKLYDSNKSKTLRVNGWVISKTRKALSQLSQSLLKFQSSLSSRRWNHARSSFKRFSQ
ncbi:MAG: hypothetical protein FJW56_06175 [Actinobacteria bacterium]|nr:hypothetical protein [Actinomycetota bacterium]